MLLYSFPKKSRKRLAHDVLLPHMLALFTTPQPQTVRHKMAAPTAIFL